VRTGLSKHFLGILLAAVAAGPVWGQHPVNPEAPEIAPAIRLIEEAIASGRGSKDNTMVCSLRRLQPVMNFSFRYQAGYRVQIPSQQFPPAEIELLEITRVTSRDTGRRFYFAQTGALPAGPRGRGTVAETGGGFFVGEGRYSVDTMLLDRDDRRCYRHWEFRLNLNDNQRELALLIEPNTVEPLTLSWTDTSERERPYSVTVFLHVAPFSPRSIRLNLFDETMLITTLRSLFDATPFHTDSIHAISLHQQRELLRFPELNRNTFLDLITAFEELDVGTVDLEALTNPEGYVDMLADLVNEELAADTPPDAIVFIGGSSRYTLSFPRDRIEPVAGGSTEFFYLQLSRFQLRRYRTTDSIQKLVKRQGGKVFRISSPEQFAKAIHKMEEILGRDSS